MLFANYAYDNILPRRQHKLCNSTDAHSTTVPTFNKAHYPHSSSVLSQNGIEAAVTADVVAPTL